MLERLKHNTKRYNFALGYILVASALILILVGAMAMGVSAAETDFVDETVELEDENDSIEIEVFWLEDADSTESATWALYNETEYADDPDNATAVTDGTMGAQPGNSTTATIDTNSTGVDAETEYRLTVTGDDLHVDDVQVSTSSGGAFFASDSERNMVLGVVALLAIGALVLRE